MNFDDSPRVLTACIAGDEAAIERLVSQYQDGVFRLAVSILGDPHEAHEATQDTFISALAALETYEERSSFKAWLYTIALNISRSRLRKRKTQEKLWHTLQSIFQVQSGKPFSPEEAVIQNEKDAALWEALKGLGEKHRITLTLFYFHDLSVAEIAQIMKTNEGTIHSRLHIGRERLRVALEKQPGFPGE